MFNAEKYWSKEHRDKLSQASSFVEVGKVALDVLHQMPDNVAQVCGPISAPKIETINKNLDIFNKVILRLEQENKIIFSQVPMENDIQRLKTDLVHYDMSLLEDIYGPLFESGKITTLYFIHGWENSKGSCWERKQAEKIGLKIIDLPKGFGF